MVVQKLQEAVQEAVQKRRLILKLGNHLQAVAPHLRFG